MEAAQAIKSKRKPEVITGNIHDQTSSVARTQKYQR
jgi:hypothetical protein